MDNYDNFDWITNNIVVGSIVDIDGTKIYAQAFENISLDFPNYKGTFFNGAHIGGFVGVIKGFKLIICRIEKEYYQDTLQQPYSNDYVKDRFVHILELSIFGYFAKNKFIAGNKFYPVLQNKVILLTNEQINSIINIDGANGDDFIKIGTNGNNDVDVSIKWSNLFNTHIGFFGNTGSGKSNTLTYLYTKLFDLQNQNQIGKNFNNNSKFIFLDFNGEYAGDKVLSPHKYICNLSPKDGKEKIKIQSEFFWNIETLSSLFFATDRTQKPFIEKVLHNIKNNPEMLDNLNTIIEDAYPKTFDKYTTKNLSEVKDVYENFKDEIGTVDSSIGEAKKFYIVMKCESIKLMADQYRYNNIFPLIERISTKYKMIDNLVEFTKDDNDQNNDPIQVISLKECDHEAQRIVTLLLARYEYYQQKDKHTKNVNHPESTVNFIVDEAHNILYYSNSKTAGDTEKDYVIETFEKIIKEGRKFGFFLTIASQRPSEISPTIISQLHNFFIHKLVNEHDLSMISKTISMLDRVTESQIPLLSPGQCVVAGTSFKIPILVNMNQLDEDQRPLSENVDLKELWKVGNQSDIQQEEEEEVNDNDAAINQDDSIDDDDIEWTIVDYHTDN